MISNVTYNEIGMSPQNRIMYRITAMIHPAKPGSKSGQLLSYCKNLIVDHMDERERERRHGGGSI
jgi:hypothetical protein